MYTSSISFYHHIYSAPTMKIREFVKEIYFKMVDYA